MSEERVPVPAGTGSGHWQPVGSGHGRAAGLAGGATGGSPFNFTRAGVAVGQSFPVPTRNASAGPCASAAFLD